MPKDTGLFPKFSRDFYLSLNAANPKRMLQ
jgi:hypothetical protein